MFKLKGISQFILIFYSRSRFNMLPNAISRYGNAGTGFWSESPMRVFHNHQIARFMFNTREYSPFNVKRSMLLSKLMRSVWMVIKTCYSTLSKESYAIIKAEINQTESRTQIPVKLMFNNWLILQLNTRNILRSKLFFL